MVGRKRKTELRDAIDVITGFRDLVNETFLELTGKSIADWLKEFQDRPRELPWGEQAAPQQKPDMPLAFAYAVLGLTPNASPEQVKTHYRNLAKVFHSDTGAMNDAAMKLLNNARDRIKEGEG